MQVNTMLLNEFLKEHYQVQDLKATGRWEDSAQSVMSRSEFRSLFGSPGDCGDRPGAHRPAHPGEK